MCTHLDISPLISQSPDLSSLFFENKWEKDESRDCRSDLPYRRRNGVAATGWWEAFVYPDWHFAAGRRTSGRSLRSGRPDYDHDCFAMRGGKFLARCIPHNVKVRATVFAFRCDGSLTTGICIFQARRFPRDDSKCSSLVAHSRLRCLLS